MRRYESYKDSGVEWLGEVPSHWELGRISTYFTERRTKVSDKDYPALSVTKLGVFPQWENVAKTNDGDNRKLAKKGDFVINSRSDRKGSSGIAKQDGSVSLINIVLQPKKINSVYSEYLFKSYSFIEEFYRVGHGIVADLWTTRFEDIKNSLIIFPPLSEQQKIAQFLDEKTAKIDQAVDLAEKQIALLKEHKQILIQNAVTRGLNPDVPLKDSGVEWIGQVPEHWEVKKMKFLFKDTSIKNKPDATLLSVTQNRGVIPRNWLEERTVMPSGNLETFKFIQKDDFAISLRSFEGGLEICHHDGIISPAYTVLKYDKKFLNNGYYKYLFKCQKFISEMQTSIVGIREGKNISYEELKYSFLPIPQIIEQQKIAQFLDEKTAKIDQAIALKTAHIEKLKEYKSVLINDVVTGKVRVSV
jgi:type I DNA specificity S subunit